MSQCNQCCRTPCECMDGGSYGHELLGVNQCHACSGTGRAPDVEATLRAENATLRESLERALVCLYGADATLDDARKVSTMVNVELDKRDAEIARLTAEVDRMTALYRKADDGHDENMRETARLIGEVERLTGAALPHNASTRPEVRRDDMGNGKLKVGRDDDGDMYVSLVLPGHGFLSVEFTTPGAGGGKSPRTWTALRTLLDAMTADSAAEAEP